MKKLIVCISYLCCLITLQAESASELMEAVRKNTSVAGLESVSTLIIRDSAGRERTRKTAMASKSYSASLEKRIIRFLEPADVKGMGMLIVDHKEIDDDMWVYIPANRQSRRIVSNEKSKSFMGSEFSNSDMSAPNLNDFTFRFLEDEMIDGHPCFQIEIKPINSIKEDEYGFVRKISWVNKTDRILLRSEYYDFDNELHKTLKVLDYRRIHEKENKFIITRMNITNEQNGRSSSLIIDQVMSNDNINDMYFTLSYLEKP